MKPEERFTKTFFGIIMIVSSFFAWGKWVLLILGSLFVISSALSICWACEIYKWFHKTNMNQTKEKK